MTKTTNGKAKRVRRTKSNRKPRRQLPEIKTYIAEKEPTDKDILGGRGGKTNNHPGNKIHWLEVLSRRQRYKSAVDDDEKTRIAQEVLDCVINKHGGRYVQQDKKEGKWYVLPNKVALDKAKQALRDKHVPKKEWVPKQYRFETTKCVTINKKVHCPAPKKAAPPTLVAPSQMNLSVNMDARTSIHYEYWFQPENVPSFDGTRLLPTPSSSNSNTVTLHESGDDTNEEQQTTKESSSTAFQDETISPVPQPAFSLSLDFFSNLPSLPDYTTSLPCGGGGTAVQSLPQTELSTPLAGVEKFLDRNLDTEGFESTW